MFEPIVYLTKGSEGWLLTILFCRVNCEQFFLIKCFLQEERIQDEVILCFIGDSDRVIFLSSLVLGFFYGCCVCKPTHLLQNCRSL